MFHKRDRVFLEHQRNEINCTVNPPIQFKYLFQKPKIVKSLVKDNDSLLCHYFAPTIITAQLFSVISGIYKFINSDNFRIDVWLRQANARKRWWLAYGVNLASIKNDGWYVFHLVGLTDVLHNNTIWNSSFIHHVVGRLKCKTEECVKMELKVQTHSVVISREMVRNLGHWTTYYSCEFELDNN